MMAGTGAEVSAVTSGAEYGEHQVRGRVPLDELARRKGVRPIQSIDDLAQDGVFESDEELEAFLAHVYASRHADLA